MDADKLRGITVGSLVAKAQELAEQMAPDEPDFANDLALALVKSLIGGGENLDQTVAVFGADDAISKGLFGGDETPATSGEEMDPDSQALLDAIDGAQSEEELDKILADSGFDTDTGDNTETPKEPVTVTQTTTSVGGLPPADDKPADEKPADEPKKEEKPADEKPADKPKKEEKPADEKPADEESESKKEDKKQEQSDTDRNIIGTLTDLK